MVKPIGRDRLRELRRLGVFAWSPLATRAVTAAGVLGVLLGTGSAWKGLATNRFDAGSDLRSQLAALGEDALRLALLTSVAAFTCGMIASLIQTRGAFGRGAQRAAIGRLKTLSASGMVVSATLSALVGGVLLYRFSPQLLDGIRVEGGPMIWAYLAAIFGESAKLVVVGSLVLAVVLVFGSRLAFVLLGAKRKAKALRDAE